jgi:ETC complex I subunit conserved region
VADDDGIAVDFHFWVFSSTMLTSRPLLRTALRRITVSRSASSEIALVNEKHEKSRSEIEAMKSPTQRKMEAMTKLDPNMVWGSLVEMEDPVLPDNPAEISALDPAGRRDNLMHDGTQRTVMIQQLPAKASQSPTIHEQVWEITFEQNGETANQWNNSLMGWTSGADPYCNMSMHLNFRTASDAVYFAKKRGWNYLVKEPQFRQPRDDGAQYQDNFLPQNVVTMLKMDRTACKHWERPSAGTSHYRRPLKFHGDGEVRQHGPNKNKEVEKHVEGYYKMR